ncbi:MULTISPECIES: SRPBCC family protein [unclassified Chryseobacterium]|jgi:carbon monoxide dehydrogenase subunit G|uniref:SRPBCC family protein n=1 Tax=unclassified Chryseobacterium TaxID=2593645 RepID=UPI001C5BF915|nr:MULTISPECIES: SRPBCC family protein [unclassified Chryseobacterium]MBW3522767.1 SRPBCC family protein [Chryseobacterium sp. NKUCC03_KSP]MCD0455427.1 SRPBCC family protein [Chryseobacterium sp. LC2016-27]
MNLEGRKIIVNKSSKDLSELLRSPENYKEFMPDGLQKFETREDGFKFGLQGMPEIALKIDEVTDEKAVLRSASSSLDFTLTATLRPLNETQTEAQMLFEGKFNPFIKMMVEKPLQNFINALTDKIEAYK